ncbi:MAG: hypothetical protein C4542_02690 [Dehalococcoidia bacterium]|nr:MAG: hypothetical protein C4542_02690 [Dehalococcoidia bacterium]
MNTGEKTRKATFNIHPEVLAALDKAMTEGVAPSKNVFVERALLKELKEVSRQARQTRWEEGARDPQLMHDIRQIETDFQAADAENAGEIV